MAKIRVWIHITDCGDGSAFARAFKTEQEAVEYAYRAFYTNGEGLLEDGINSVDIDLTEGWEEV